MASTTATAGNLQHGAAQPAPPGQSSQSGHPTATGPIQVMDRFYGPGVATRWPGMLTFCEHQEEKHVHLKGKARDMFTAVRADICEPGGYWRWLLDIFEQIDRVQQQGGRETLESVSDRLLSSGGASQKQACENAVLIALSSALGMATCVPDDAASPSETVWKHAFNKRLFVVYSQESIFDNLSRIAEAIEVDQQGGPSPEDRNISQTDNRDAETGDALYERKLNFGTLSTIGKLQIKWVDTIEPPSWWDNTVSTV